MIKTSKEMKSTKTTKITKDVKKLKPKTPSSSVVTKNNASRPPMCNQTHRALVQKPMKKPTKKLTNVFHITINN